MSYELFVEWLSERGAGRWQAFTLAHEWLFNAGRSQADRVEASWTARTLAGLGHLEIDWNRQSWAATPPLLTILPNAGARSLLTGGRTRTLATLLEAETAEGVTDNVVYERYKQVDAPDAIFLVSRDELDIERLASTLGIDYEYSAADRLSKLLPLLDAYLAASASTPAPVGYEARRFDPVSLTWSVATTDRLPGLYSYAVYGLSRHRFVSDASAHHDVERAVGIYAELHRVGRSVLAWKADDVNGTLIVPGRAPLPDLHARAVTACSGLAPKYLGTEQARRYVNVPEAIATRIAISLGQTLVRASTGGVHG
jgi:hypothetical protein